MHVGLGCMLARLVLSVVIAIDRRGLLTRWTALPTGATTTSGNERVVPSTRVGNTWRDV
jgi:hypothetical protein